MSVVEVSQDRWAQWLLQRRHGGDPATLAAMVDDLYRFRDTVLGHAAVTGGEVLLDVGAGDGLIAFGALPLVGEQGTVIFSDISQDLLDRCQVLADEVGASHRCRFLRASADNLSAVGDATVDVVTIRSVLIYVPAKQQAVQEFYRVLAPGGRLSIFEPINRFASPEPPHLFCGYDVTPIGESAANVRAVYDRLQPRETDPMLDFDERDLIALVEQAGFGEIHLDLHIEVRPVRPEPWESFLRRSGNPTIPMHDEAIREALTPAEVERFTAHLRPLVEQGRGTWRMAVAYLWAVK